MVHQIIQFVIKHWALVSAFIIVLVLLILEEVRSQKGRGYVSSTEATQLINHDNAQVIDLRETSAFRDGHIVGSKNIPLADFDREKDKLTDKTQPLILVDAMGLKTHTISQRLKAAEFEKVFILKGGIERWKADTMPLVKGQK